MIAFYLLLAGWAVVFSIILYFKYSGCKHYYVQMWSGDGTRAPEGIEKWSYYRICRHCNDWYYIKESQRDLYRGRHGL